MSDTPELYINYKPVPRRDRRFLRLLVPTVLWGLCAAGAVIGMSIPDAGTGLWDTADTVVLTGEVVAAPYPALVTEFEGERATVLLIDAGKVGIRDDVAAMAGRTASFEGFIIHRSGGRMLELMPGEAAFASGASDPAPGDGALPSGMAGEAVTIRGEIVDFKCFLGAMKPGEGVTHRACARLCISAGIPAALVVRDAAGAETAYLLRSPEGDRLGPWLLPHVGWPVEVTGRPVREHGLLYLEIDESDVTRR